MQSRTLMVPRYRAAWLIAASAIAIACTERTKTPETVQAGAPAAATLTTAPDQFVAFGDVRLRYRDAARDKSGTPVVFIHGYSRSLEDMLAIADSFAVDHRVIGYDVRGFGQSSKSGDPRRYGAAMADDVIRLLDSLKIDRAHLVGHSMGAIIAANVAARYPQRVASASLIAGPFYADSATFARQTARWVRDLERGAGLRNFLPWLFPGMPDSIARGLSDTAMAHNDSATMVATMRSFGGLTVPSNRLARASVPVFVTAGGNDPLLPLSRSLAKQWPKAQLVEVKSVDHVEILNRPEVLAGMRAIMRASPAP